MKDCNHCIGLSRPKHSKPKLHYLSDRLKWRGTIFYYCPNCGVKQWKWIKKGNYKIKEYCGKEKI